MMDYAPSRIRILLAPSAPRTPSSEICFFPLRSLRALREIILIFACGFAAPGFFAINPLFLARVEIS